MRQQLEDGQTVVLNMSKDKALMQWAKDNGVFVRIDRATKWGNPYPMASEAERDEVCDKYDSYLSSKPELLNQLYQLKGKALGCWCNPKRCHGHSLQELINQLEEV